MVALTFFLHACTPRGPVVVHTLDNGIDLTVKNVDLDKKPGDTILLIHNDKTFDYEVCEYDGPIEKSWAKKGEFISPATGKTIYLAVIKK